MQIENNCFNYHYHSPVLTRGTVFVVLLVLGVVLGEVVVGEVVLGEVVVGEVMSGEVVLDEVGLDELEGSATLSSSGFWGI